MSISRACSHAYLCGLEKLCSERIEMMRVCGMTGFRETPTMIDVIIVNAKISPDLYEENLGFRVFTYIFNKLVNTAHGAPPNFTKRIYKSYASRDLIYENTGNVDVRIYRTIVHACESWDDPLCIGVASVREKMPVSAFPCTTSLNDVSYVKTTTVRMSPHINVVFESKRDIESRFVHKIYVRAVISPVKASSKDELQSISDSIRKIVNTLCIYRDEAKTVSPAPAPV